jgi:extracellular factor (EF) 3-hydroxypalmitic acid methyl ester biosynthesis protein
MIDTSNSEYSVTCQASAGADIRGKLLRMERHRAVFELSNAACVLQASEVLHQFVIRLGDRTLYSGRAGVRNAVETGSAVTYEVQLDSGWMDVDFAVERSGGTSLQQQLKAFLTQQSRTYHILPEFKLVIADMQSLLLDLRAWLEQLELGVRAAPAGNRAALEQQLSHTMGETVSQSIDMLWSRFEPVAERIDPDFQPAHRAYLQRHLHPLVLCSPFAYRTYHKPLGYAGDYEVVNMIARNPFEGSSLYARMLNHWFLRQPPAEAHRNRLNYLHQKLVEETLRTAAHSRTLRVFNLGCGPAIEVQRFIETNELSAKAQFTLLDFNDETLAYATATLNTLKSRHGRSTLFEPVKKSVHQILKEASRSVVTPGDGKYDFIYCAGLFDYLPDSVCRRLVEIFFKNLAPGGLLLTTNVSAVKPFHISMDYILDWPLICRTGHQMQAMATKLNGQYDVTVQSDITGVNLFFELRKHV